MLDAPPVMVSGSSPRARGTLRPASQAGPPDRFIPACAGNAFQSSPCHLPMAVHPRVRGERLRTTTRVGIIFGSSPRARGTRVGVRRVERRERFIPACAGNAIIIIWTTVHPRVRGERTTGTLPGSKCTGSSPRARGTRRSTGRIPRRARFIPACAGNAPPRLHSGRPIPVHPRVRGERAASSVIQISTYGSSPRARGTRSDPQGRSNRARFIPACAGNAMPPGAAESAPAVHPRVRGERI